MSPQSEQRRGGNLQLGLCCAGVKESVHSRRRRKKMKKKKRKNVVKVSVQTGTLDAGRPC